MEKKRTINGMTFDEVMEKLREPFEDLIADGQGHPAVPIEFIEERLDEVLGLNYSFSLLSEPKLQSIPSTNGEENIYLMGCGTLSVYDDNGQLVKSFTQGGGVKVIYVKETGAPKDPTNDLQACISDILKKCAKSGLGVGRYISVERKRNKANGNGSQNAKFNGKKDNSSTPETKSSLSTKTDTVATFSIVAKPNIMEKCIMVKAKDVSGKEGTLLFWKDAMSAFPEEAQKKIKLLKPGSLIVAKYKLNIYDGNTQFIVEQVLPG